MRAVCTELVEDAEETGFEPVWDLHPPSFSRAGRLTTPALLHLVRPTGLEPVPEDPQSSVVSIQLWAHY